MKQYEKLELAGYILTECGKKLEGHIVNDTLFAEIKRALALVEEVIKSRKAKP